MDDLDALRLRPSPEICRDLESRRGFLSASLFDKHGMKVQEKQGRFGGPIVPWCRNVGCVEHVFKCRRHCSANGCGPQ